MFLGGGKDYTRETPITPATRVRHLTGQGKSV